MGLCRVCELRSYFVKNGPKLIKVNNSLCEAVERKLAGKINDTFQSLLLLLFCFKGLGVDLQLKLR